MDNRYEALEGDGRTSEHSLVRVWRARKFSAAKDDIIVTFLSYIIFVADATKVVRSPPEVLECPSVQWPLQQHQQCYASVHDWSHCGREGFHGANLEGFRQAP